MEGRGVRRARAFLLSGASRDFRTFLAKTGGRVPVITEQVHGRSASRSLIGPFDSRHGTGPESRPGVYRHVDSLGAKEKAEFAAHYIDRGQSALLRLTFPWLKGESVA